MEINKNKYKNSACNSFVLFNSLFNSPNKNIKHINIKHINIKHINIKHINVKLINIKLINLST